MTTWQAFPLRQKKLSEVVWLVSCRTVPLIWSNSRTSSLPTIFSLSSHSTHLPQHHTLQLSHYISNHVFIHPKYERNMWGWERESNEEKSFSLLKNIDQILMNRCLLNQTHAIISRAGPLIFLNIWNRDFMILRGGYPLIWKFNSTNKENKYILLPSCFDQ